ncbi:MAG: four helix bundle protein [Clostridia bacterium]|nr:four helix bundle protein [Clostridia bacterium]
MSESILRDKSKEFAKNIVFLCRELKNRKIESVLTNQLLRSGTSVGANIFEGKYAQGCKDLISKFEIALKEINESEYWLELIYETDGMTDEEFNKLKSECINIRRMLVASVKTIKSKEQK